MPDLEMALPQACKECPWRVENHGRRRHGHFTASNRRRLWAGLRSGKAPGMTCHGTDPRTKNPDAHEDFADNAGRDATHECAGAIALVQRELLVFQNLAEAVPADAKPGRAFTVYRAFRPGGLTRDGFGEWISRQMFGGTPFARALKQPTEPFLDQPVSNGLPWDGCKVTLPQARRVGAEG